MKLKKIIASIAAAAVAVSMMAVNALAATIELDSEYVGAWGAGKTIPKAELEAIGGDVEITLTIEVREPLLPDQQLIAPMDYDNSWTRITDKLTTNGTLKAKSDGFIGVQLGTPSISFVVPADVIASLGDSGIGFQVQNVIVKSAELAPGAPASAIDVLEEPDVKAFCQSTYEPSADAAPAAEEAPAETTAAPAAAETTTAPATGNVPAAVMVSVMAVAGAAAVAAKQRK